MITLKAVFVISVLISGLIFSPSYSFAQSNQNDNPLASFFESLMKIFSFDDEPSEPVVEFSDATVIQTSGTSSTDTTENNILPMAEAGPEQTVMEFDDVMLDGSSSTDLDGTIVSYKWTQVNGTTVFLEDDDTDKPTFVAPAVDVQEILEFMLAVVDNSSGTDTDKVKITVKEVNKQPDDTPTDGNDPIDDGENKITICHIPPGNPENAHLITVGEPAVVAHIAHGDTLTLEDCPDFSSTEDLEDNSNKGNSGKGNSDKDKNEKSNSGKGNSGVDNSGKGSNDNENKPNNSGKGNSGVDNSGKGNSDKDKNEKSNSGKGNNVKNEVKIEDEHEDDDDDEDEDEDD
jgi:hypothetical protein